MTQDVNCVISLISISVFRLSHHIAALFLSCLGRKTPQKWSDTVKKYFSFCHFSSFMQNLQQIAEMHRCDSNRVWRRRGKNPTETRSESCKVEKTSTSNHKCDWLEAESLETWSVPSLEQRAADAHNPLTVAAVHSQSLFPLFLLLFPSFSHPSHQHRHSENHCILPSTVTHFFFFFTIPARFQFRASAAASAQQTATSVQFNVSESLIHW